ncbi:MAG: GntR family transcriptional regulator [Clostridiales bacterium]|nr:GntR family transcriptional regulator [Clostridiales bacterium]
MGNSTELRKGVYSVLLTQIQFNAYRCGEKLPTIEETGTQLGVSVDTARAAYLRLKDEGYITLSKNIGATVKPSYDRLETEQFIQSFFAARRHTMKDLNQSMYFLFRNAQWNGLKNASSETLHAMEQLDCKKGTMPAPFVMLQYLNQKYSSLGNTLLMRLVWQASMFMYGPFFSLGENLRYFNESVDYMPEILSLCQNQDWLALRVTVDQSIEQMSLALTRFYGARITMPSPKQEIMFTWSSYKKSQQLCYSLAMDLLISISRGIYPVGSILPSQKELALQKNVSVSTIRRAFELLYSIGAIKSAKYAGTRVLPFDQSTKNCDFTKPVLQRRLVDMAESLQVFALSCRDVSKLTLSSLDADSVQKLCNRLKVHKQRQGSVTLSYFILDMITNHAPFQGIRTIYSELLRQFFWAYSLRGITVSLEAISTTYDPYFDKLIQALEQTDFSRFSATLEDFLLHELRSIVNSLSQLSIPGAENILIPDRSMN